MWKICRARLLRRGRIHREHEKEKRGNLEYKKEQIHVLVSSIFLKGQPELISRVLGSSGQDWVGCCQKQNPPLVPISLCPGVTTHPASSSPPPPLSSVHPLQWQPKSTISEHTACWWNNYCIQEDYRRSRSPGSCLCVIACETDRVTRSEME